MRALFSDAFDSRQQHATVDAAEGYLAASGATGTSAAAAAADSPRGQVTHVARSISYLKRRGESLRCSFWSDA